MGNGERPIRVAVVEDDDDLLRLFADLFADAGFVVTLTVAPEGFPTRWDGDVIVVDPGVRAYERETVERRLRCLRQRSSAGIVLISTHVEAERDAAAMGADAFVATPFDIEVMLAVVREVSER